MLIEKGISKMEKQKYIESNVEVTIFKEGDILTTSAGIELPDDEW